MIIKITDNLAEKTVLHILKNELRFSAKIITSLKKREKGITVDGEHVTVRRVLKQGEILSLETEDTKANENLVKTAMPLDIVFEDDDIILINKPPYLPTHQSHGHFEDTLANGVAFHMGDSPFIFRAVNRLDRNTSGLVLIAKNRVAAARLYGSMQNGEIKKKYIAVLCGTPPEPDGRIHTYIRRKEASIITREVCGKTDDSAEAITDYSLIAASENISAVLASPVTGRTHQLRLHFAHIGTPIIGDDLYGKPSDMIGRQALHAYSLSLPHPTQGIRMTFTAPLPVDMEELLGLNNIKIEV